MPHSCLYRVMMNAALMLLLCASPAYAVTIYDVGADEAPILPTLITSTNTPVYITNTRSGDDDDDDSDSEVESRIAATVETMRVGQRTQLHLGYGPENVAADSLSVNVTNSMLVEGLVRLGKDKTYYADNLPNAETTHSISLNVGGALTVANGGSIIANGAADGTEESSGDEEGSTEAGEQRYSTIRANSVVLDGGSMTLEEFSTLSTGKPAADSTANTDWYGVTVQNGGMLLLNSGLPASIGSVDPDEDGDGGDGDGDGESRAVARLVGRPGLREDSDTDPDDDLEYFAGGSPLLDSEGDEWVFRGADVSAGGQGVLVGNGGVVSTGRAGGVIRGRAGQRIEVRSGGALDVSKGNLIVTGIDAIDIDGKYQAGYDKISGNVTHMIAPDATVSFGSGSTVALDRNLQRKINRDGGVPQGDVLLQGGAVQFADGAPVLTTGMGTYGLEVARNADDTADYLRVGWVENGVLGSSTSSDKDQFRSNMSGIWANKMRRDQAENIYNLTVQENPSITTEGSVGALNKAVLEALVDGKGQTVSGGSGSLGYVDEGVYEMYNLSSLWGVNSAAFNTAEEFMSQLDRRVDRIGAEMDRLGLAASTEVLYGGVGFASYGLDFEDRPGRVWAGGFGRSERATFNERSGYKFTPKGVMTGYDREIGRMNFGVAGAYGRGDYEDKIASANDSTITSYSAGLYGSYHGCGGTFLSAQASYSYFDNDISDVRGGMKRTADHSGYAWTLGARLGFDKLVSDRIILTPSVGVNRVRSTSRAHDEYLDGVGVLKVGRMKRDSLTAPVELGVGVDLIKDPDKVLRLVGSLGYAYDFYDGALDGIFNYAGLTGSAVMEASDRKAGRSRINTGVGLVFTGRKLDFTTRYDYYYRENQKTHQAQGSIGVKF